MPEYILTSFRFIVHMMMARSARSCCLSNVLYHGLVYRITVFQDLELPCKLEVYTASGDVLLTIHVTQNVQ